MDPRVKFLLSLPQPEQRTPEWFKARENKLTASSIASLCIRDDNTCDPYIQEFNLYDSFDKNFKSCNPYSSKKQYLLDKINRTFNGNTATYWGQKYEPVATDIYSINNNSSVLEFGLIAHNSIDFLAASPDGITPDGIMLEIKCPFRRKITGIPPFYYWIQVQIQLEVCNLDYCDFAEYEFTEFNSLHEFIDDHTLSTPILEKGLFLQLEYIPDKPEKREYFYPPKDILNKSFELLKWKENTIEKIVKDKKLDIIRTEDPYIVCQLNDKQKFNIRTIYWKLTAKSVVRIKRNTKWFNDIKPHLEKTHKEVMFYMKNKNMIKDIMEYNSYSDSKCIL